MNRIIFIAVIILMGFLTSCKKTVYACFTVLTPADSMHVGYPIRFDGTCSGGMMYFWNFGDGNGSAQGERMTEITYSTFGTYNITLDVAHSIRVYNYKSGNTTITVLP